MRIFKRLSDIISANLNDLLARAEDPEKMLKQALREMEQGLEAARRVAMQAVTEEKRLKKELEHNEKQASDWEAKAAQAVKADRDDLAKKALARRMEIENVVASIRAEHEEVSESAEQTKRTLKALGSRLSEAKRQEATLVARKKVAEARKAVVEGMERLKQESDGLAVQEKTERLEHELAGLGGKAEALAELSADEIEMEDLGANGQIEAELAKLKARHGGENK